MDGTEQTTKKVKDKRIPLCSAGILGFSKKVKIGIICASTEYKQIYDFPLFSFTIQTLRLTESSP